jgi:hypothetical protein
MVSPVRALGPATGLLLLAGCYFSGDTRVLVTSTPPGAEILVDGEATGATTPAHLDLGGYFGDDHAITIRMPGYEDETRQVVHHNIYYSSRWIDGTDFRLWAFPLWWTLGDFFTPFAVRWIYVPHEVHVLLYPVGEAPVHGSPQPLEEAEPGPDS